jgi:hypothetical protein
MRKLRLEIDELKVETFDAGGSDTGGTVRAHEDTNYGGPCLDPFDDSINYCGTGQTYCGTCGGSTCAGTCDYSCGCYSLAYSTCNPVQCYTSEPYVE